MYRSQALRNDAREQPPPPARRSSRVIREDLVRTEVPPTPSVPHRLIPTNRCRPWMPIPPFRRRTDSESHRRLGRWVKPIIADRE